MHLVDLLEVTVDVRGLHTPVKMAGFCEVRNETKMNHVRNFSTLNVKLQRIKFK